MKVKKFFSLLLIVVMITTMCTPIFAATEAATLLHSWTFENKDKSEFRGSMSSFEFSQEYKKSGNVSLKVVGDEEHSVGWFWFYNDIVFEKGKQYSIRFYAMTTSDSADVSAELQPAASGSVVTKAIPIGTWGEYTANFTWNKDTTDADVLIKVGGMYDIYIDDVEIYEGLLSSENSSGTDGNYNQISAGQSAENIYVDMSQTTDGTGSIENPFNSVESAQEYVRNNNDSMSQDIIVNIKGGFYEIENTIALTEEDSGTNGHYVIYQPYGYNQPTEESVVLSGGKKVKGWETSEISGVYKAHLETDYLRNLYVNGKRAQRARYNELVTPVAWWNDTENTLSDKDGFEIPNGIIKDPASAKNLEIYKNISFKSLWAVKGKAIANGDTTIISMEQPYFHINTTHNSSGNSAWDIEDNFRLENALEFLDEPGEWYHDSDSNTLYYKPRTGETITDCEVIAPVTEQIMTIAGSTLEDRAQNIIVRGLTFSFGAYKRTSRMGRTTFQSTVALNLELEGYYNGFQYNTEGNIILSNAKNVSFQDNIVSHMGGVGIMMPTGVDNCELLGNAIHDISSSAVTVGYNNQSKVTDWRIVPRNILIKNNIINKTGVEYNSDPGIQGYYTNGLTISHNEIFDTSYSGICVGWGWEASGVDTKRNNVIENNRIYDYGKYCQDGGGIYTLGAQPSSVVKENYIRAYVQDIAGIYHDEGSSGFTTTDNVIDLPADSMWSGLFIHTAKTGLTITENYTNVNRSTNSKSVSFDNYETQGATRSADALSIRENAGLESSCKSIRESVADYQENTSIQRIYLQTEEKGSQNTANVENGGSLTLKTLGESLNGEISVLSENLSYSVSDATVLAISGDKVTAKKEGISTVSVSDGNGHTAFMTVTVGDELVKFELLANKKSVEADESVRFVYRLTTKYTEYVGVPRKSELYSSDSGVLAVTTDGRAKGVSDGNATITANVTVGDISASGNVAVGVCRDSYRTFKVMDYADKVSQSTILNLLGGNDESVITETTFVNAVAAVTERSSSEICSDIKSANLTKERMAAIGADTLVNVYGEALMGDSEIYYYSDASSITPSLIPKVAMAYKYGLLSWTDGAMVFEPKSEVTAAMAKDFIYRLIAPNKQSYLRTESDEFNSTEYSEFLYTNQLSVRTRDKQSGIEAVGENIINQKLTVHEGTGSVSSEDNELVYMVDRNSRAASILLLYDVDFVPGKTYTAKFSAKLSNAHSSTSSNKITASPTGFTAESGTGAVSETRINSNNWTVFTVNIGVPASAEISSTTDTHYYIYMNNSSSLDISAYDVLFKDIEVVEAADIPISSSSIADGETDVLTPIDSLYFSTDCELLSDSVTVDKVSITGTGAAITAVTPTDSKTVCVEIDGILPENDYVLTVSGIQNISGGMLYDTISFATAEANSTKSGKWDFETHANKIASNNTTYITVEGISADYSKEGAKSLKLTTIGNNMINLNGEAIGFKKEDFVVGKSYFISLWAYCPTKSANLRLFKHSGSPFASCSVATGNWTKLSGIYTPAEAPGNDLFQMDILNNPGTIYLDNIEIKELAQYPVTVYRPNIFKDGVPVSSVTEGDITVQYTILGGTEAKEVWSVIAQYDENNHMKNFESATNIVAAGAVETVTIRLPKAKDLDTKIFNMGKTSYEPYNDVICFYKE